MIVDDSNVNIDVLVHTLGNDYDISVAKNGIIALEIMRKSPPDLVLLDIMMPEMDGIEVYQRMKKDPSLRDISVIFITAMGAIFNEEKGLALGAVDYIVKPIQPRIVKLRVSNHIELLQAQKQLQNQNIILERKVEERTREIQKLQDVTIESLASLAETRDPETGHHILRTKLYVKVILEALTKQHPSLTKDKKLIINSSPLHDIGKVGIPDHILLKPGKLTLDEFNIIKLHTTYGWQALKRAQKQTEASSFLKFASDMAHSHHEKWDGSGYPQGLKGKDIPLVGRIMAIADVYDALISRRSYKDPFSHEEAIEIITVGDGRTSPDHFDPEILQAFKDNQQLFLEISQKYSEDN